MSKQVTRSDTNRIINPDNQPNNINPNEQLHYLITSDNLLHVVIYCLTTSSSPGPQKPKCYGIPVKNVVSTHASLLACQALLLSLCLYADVL